MRNGTATLASGPIRPSASAANSRMVNRSWPTVGSYLDLVPTFTAGCACLAGRRAGPGWQTRMLGRYGRDRKRQRSFCL